MNDYASMTLAELEAFCLARGEKKFRAAQLFEWIHAKRVSSFSGMTNLPKTFLETLSREGFLADCKTVHTQTSALDGTSKYLFELPDGALIESVAMPYRFGLSVCVSSQVGCAMGCVFCASATNGLDRNLSAAEMLMQVYAIERERNERVARIVVMGAGEPFQNYEALSRFIALVSDAKGARIGRRRITVSTCGIVPRIDDFAADHPQVNLAISLHAATQEKREALMPVAKAYPLDDLMDACRRYAKLTRRRLTFEYALMKGVNDGEEDAVCLRDLLTGVDSVVNLIPVNPVVGKTLSEPDKTHVREFQKMLEKMGINGTIRREMGRDIDGACGQLVRRYKDAGESSC